MKHFKFYHGQIPFTPRARKVLELAPREALSLGHNYIGTEHILLGLVSEDEGIAARILLDFDADSEKIRNEVIERLRGPGGRPQPMPIAHLRRGLWELDIALKGFDDGEGVEPYVLRVMRGHFERLRLKAERAGLI